MAARGDIRRLDCSLEGSGGRADVAIADVGSFGSGGLHCEIYGDVQVIIGGLTSGDRPAARVPRAELERRLHDLWCDVLGLEDVGHDEPFFEAGGDSLLLGILRDRVARDLGADLPAFVFLERPTIASLADRLVASAPDEESLQARAVDRARARRARQRGPRRESEPDVGG
jgi:Phosphopantetheine attachment site